jgi:hypothetical protein
MNKWENELNRAFSMEEVQMAKHTHTHTHTHTPHKERLNIPGHKEVKIKTTMRFYHTPIRWIPSGTQTA